MAGPAIAVDVALAFVVGLRKGRVSLQEVVDDGGGRFGIALPARRVQHGATVAGRMFDE